ncbi:MAG: peptide chain release factor 3 [Christensenellales bacterium]|jgi:peptide chain release factor 3
MSYTPEQIADEIRRRRTFAIISHPDAGKTTLTEKLLLYGGAIRLAGSVKARKASRHATSDWMEIEKQRGISVTSSVMQFDYDGYRINILDTPGHQDFSEDTYRTLVAADSAVMLIDAAKGVEAQTIKLFQVCRLRHIPIFTFVNKMDRAGRSPFDLMDELEQVLGIRACPINWPIGTDGDFKGVYHRQEAAIEVYSGGDHGQRMVSATRGSVDDPALRELIGESYHDRLMEEIELLDMAGDALDMEQVAQGQLTPMFFGSAMNNFGVQSFLEKFLAFTAPPTPRVSQGETVDPANPNFSGFIFKIQANMNPAHRDRLAFMRVCSGVFEKGMQVVHSATGKPIKLAQPQQFMADERHAVEEAFAGDIIGLFDPGIFGLGDTLYQNPKQPIQYEGIPVFAPEFFARVSILDSMRRKQFVKGITQLAQEGAIQTFKEINLGLEEVIVGVVGQLQLDVLTYRLQSEYGVEIKVHPLPFRFVRWVVAADNVDRLQLTSTTRHAVDRWDRRVLLFENDWSIRWALENNDSLQLSDVAERQKLAAED